MDPECHRKDGPAAFRCVKCGEPWCEGCVVDMPERPHVKMCPDCRDMARPIVDTRRWQAGLSAALPEVLSAPFRTPAVFVVVISAALLCVSYGFYWFHPGAWAAAGGLIVLYLNAYATAIAVATVQDEAEPYGWDASGGALALLFLPSARLLSLLAVALGIPLSVASAGHTRVAVVLGVGSLLWLPMAWLRVTLFERLMAAFSPAVGFAILRTAPRYVLVVLPLIAAVAAPVVFFARAPSPALICLVPLVPITIVIAGRLLGLFYLHQSDVLDWFGESSRYYTPIR